MDEQLKPAHKVFDVVDRANRKICVTLLRYIVDKPESSYAQVRILARKMEDEKFQQIVYVKFKLRQFIYLLDVMNSVYDKVITNNPFVISYERYFHLFTLYHYFSVQVKTNWNNGDNRNIFLKLKSKLGLYHVVLTTPNFLPKTYNGCS